MTACGVVCKGPIVGWMSDGLSTPKNLDYIEIPVLYPASVVIAAEVLVG